jgi:membrane associated rhomboid family serine protease
MIPLRDTIPSKGYPVVNYTLIGINAVVYLIQAAQGAGIGAFIYTYGLVPVRYSDPHVAAYFTLGQQLFSLVSFMFLHGGFWHILGNIWFLYIFGDNVEDRLGSFYYFIFYLSAGISSGLLHLALNLHSTVPTIGASGAIAGVMGAYLALYPKSRILTLIPVFIFPWLIEIPAFFFLGLWFVIQVLQATARDAHVAGIAWWAHIGGFVFGMACIKLLNILPEAAVPSGSHRSVVKKKKTDRLQVIHPTGPPGKAHLYDVIRITPYESAAGTRKMVNIPWGFYNRFYNVFIPPGTAEGAILRLKGLGRQMPDGQRGDLFLEVQIDRSW